MCGKTFKHAPPWVLVGLALLLGAAPAKAQQGKTAQATSKFASGGEKITVTRYEPALPGKYPALLLVHGLQCVQVSQDKLDYLGTKYAGQGYAVFLVHYFDRTGTREKDLGPIHAKLNGFGKTGKIDDTTCRLYHAWLDTVRDALAHVRGQPNVDGEHVALVGFSLGTFLSLTLAADDRLGIAAVVEFFGGMPGHVRSHVKTLPPVLGFHGDLDTVVPVSEAHALEELARARNFPLEMHIFKGVGHLFKGPQGEYQLQAALRADALMAAWLRNDWESRATFGEKCGLLSRPAGIKRLTPQFVNAAPEVSRK